METIGLVLSCILTFSLVIFLVSKKKKNQLQKIFILDSLLIFLWCLFLLAQKHFCASYNINPINFDYFIYIFICFLPVSIFFTGLIFANTKIKFKKKYMLLFIIPILSLIMLWTNNFHHLFYINYSTDFDKTTYGNYFYIHNTYTLILYFVGLIYLIAYSIKNSGIFSKQAILFILAILVPITVNVLGVFQIVPMSIYLTPISFSYTIFLCALAIFKFKLTTLAPIALQKIVDLMSDSYIVLNEDDVITDFNETFLKVFNLKSTNVRNTNIFDLISSKNEFSIDTQKLKNALKEVKSSNKTVYFNKQFITYNKYFHIEINTINSRQNFLGTLILFKDTTQHMQDMQTIRNNQDMLMERERLASLGQLIGGIAHNLKTPIMSISGAAEGLNDLIREYDSSIEDAEVTVQDHHDIAKDMNNWVKKIREYTEYMSDVITAVKGQAVVMSEQDSYNFTIDELVKRVDILMKHELKHSLINLKTNVKTDGNFELKGNVNSLVQVINNMISNSIQAYNGKTNQDIEFTIYKEKSYIVISIKDYAGGLPKEVGDKLFKEMITTKGKNGTGLGLFMSYSNIRAHFNGNITANWETGVGTEFKINIPV